MRFEFHPEALVEYNEAGFYYAKQQPGLDLRFIVCVETAIKRILEDPQRWRPFDEDVRRCLTRVFPTVFFTRSSPTTCSSWLWRIAAVNRDIGNTARAEITGVGLPAGSRRYLTQNSRPASARVPSGDVCDRRRRRGRSRCGGVRCAGRHFCACPEIVLR